MGQEFVVRFVCETGSYDYMESFKQWLKDKVECEFFVDNFRTHEIVMYQEKLERIDAD